MYVMIIDTETANSIDQPLPYDFGWAIVDTETGEIVDKHSYVCAEIFLDKELMSSAYFAEKVPHYWDDIKSGKRQLKKFLNIRKELWSCLKTFNIKHVGAYNMGFDKRASNNDTRYLTSSYLRWFFPFKVELFCIWHMACTSFLNTSDYIRFALDNGFVSEAGNIQTSAECAYRYLVNDTEFEESHTGLEDVLIETAIYLNCLKTGTDSMKSNPYTCCWRNVQRTFKELSENGEF